MFLTIKTTLQKIFIEGHLWAGSTPAQNFSCGRISVIVHGSANDKLVVDSLVLLVCGQSLIPPGKFLAIKDLWTGVWQTLQVFIYTQLYYELQCYENPMKMSLKTQESIFQGPEYRYFIFMAYFSGHEFSMKSW